MKLIKVKCKDYTNFASLKPGKILVFKDGEEWIVVPSSRMSTHGHPAGRADEVMIRPSNELAKKNNISLAIAINEKDYLENVLRTK